MKYPTVDSDPSPKPISSKNGSGLCSGVSLYIELPYIFRRASSTI
jgi:hypothetical protein